MAGESDKTNDKGYFPCPYVAVTFCIKFMSKSGKPERRAKFGACQKLFNNVNKCQIFLTLVSFFYYLLCQPEMWLTIHIWIARGQPALIKMLIWV